MDAVKWLEGDAKKADKDPQAGDYLGTKVTPSFYHVFSVLLLLRPFMW
jgi:hypothetical protein